VDNVGKIALAVLARGEPFTRDFAHPTAPSPLRMSDKLDIMLTINGRDFTIRVEPRKTLVDAIRDDCGQTGTHIGCEHGVCGACTVILDNEAVRSCLMFAVQAQGRKIRTVEGLGTGDELHPLQRAFMAHHALQCGFCTPGFLMLAVNALEQRPDISDEEIVDLLASNLCRCTGYQNIIKAVRAARNEMRAATFARAAQEQSLAAANSPQMER
jgi:carbon-monoxide dehydrogenase small subunit